MINDQPTSDNAVATTPMRADQRRRAYSRPQLPPAVSASVPGVEQALYSGRSLAPDAVHRNGIIDRLSLASPTLTAFTSTMRSGLATGTGRASVWFDPLCTFPALSFRMGPRFRDGRRAQAGRQRASRVRVGHSRRRPLVSQQKTGPEQACREKTEKAEGWQDLR